MSSEFYPLSFNVLLSALEAAGEVTRFRILALLAEGEFTVSELMIILEQSQPRVSRHLKLLVESGLVERHKEGSWAFFRISNNRIAKVVVSLIIGNLDKNDASIVCDRQKLAAVRHERMLHAYSYFASYAAQWDDIRALHISEDRIIDEIGNILRQKPINSLLDIGTGTGSMLLNFASEAARVVGIDISPAMLNVARVALDSEKFKHVQLRQGDIYDLPKDIGTFDLVLLHQVLHYLDDPARALREVARFLRPGGRLIVVDFAPHSQEILRQEHAHRRLGFRIEEVESMLIDAGLKPVLHHVLKPEVDDGKKLACILWLAQDTRIMGDFPIFTPQKNFNSSEVA